MKKNIRLLLFLFCTFPTAYISGQTKNNIVIKFIETSDVHGSIFPFDYINNKTTNNSLANAFTYIKKERSNKDQEVVLLDDGDILQGQPVVYYYNYVDTAARNVCASVMNFMKYDAASVGNHDIEAGHAVYDRVNKAFSFPWLAANITVPGTDSSYFRPYTILVRNGIKIAILGLCTPGVPAWLPHVLWSGMEFNDMIKSAKKWIPIIKQKEKPDLIVGLFHSGTDYDYDSFNASSDKNPNASLLVAEKVNGFDIIFTGHDHKLTWLVTHNPSGKPVYLAGPSAHCKNLVSVTVNFSYNNISGVYDKTFRMDTIWTKNYPPDQEFVEKFKTQNQDIARYISEKPGSITETISTRPSMFGDSKFVDLIHTVQLETTGAQISFAAPLSFNATIPKGTLSVSDLFKLYKYENFLCTLKMTGREIEKYLEYSYSNWFEKMPDSTSQLIRFKKDRSGRYVRNSNGNLITETNPYNYDDAAGIIYKVDINAAHKNYITILGMADGSPFHPDSVYTVAVNSYRACGGGGLMTLGAGIPESELPNRVITSTTIDFRYYLKEWIRKKRIVTPVLFHNWTVVPANWYESAKKRSAIELFKTTNIGQ